ncbi:MAG: hypothetical protein QXQ14_00915 [Candidatus Aenigmatarchaeota archaeon]
MVSKSFGAIFNNFIILLFLFSVVFAQNETNPLEIVLGIIPVIIVILILLWLGGVFKAPGGRFPLAPILYVLLIVIIFVLPLLQRLGYIKIFPDTISSETLKQWGFPQQNKLPDFACKVLTGLTLQEEIACYVPELIFFFILPFAAIFAITWAFLKMLNIFENVPNADNIYRLLAFIIAFMTIPMGIFMILIATWFSFLGAFSIAVFVAMFIAGVFFRGYGYIRAEAYGVALKTLSIRIKEARAKFEKLLDQVDDLSVDALRNELKDLRRAYGDLDAVVSEIPTKTEIDNWDKNTIKQRIQNIINKLK